MKPKIVSIFLDYKCNFWCDHCSVGSSPATSMPMSDEVFDSFFTQLKDISSIEVVVFTGGECTLRLDKLLEGIKRAKECGKIARIVTNGSWAINETKTREMISLLREAGLDEINTSFDTYHNAFVSAKNIANLVKVAHEFNMHTAVSILIDSSGKWNRDLVISTIAECNGWSFQECSTRVVFIEDSPTPVGSGEIEDINLCASGKSSGLGCVNILKTIAIHPNGSVSVCCGHTVFYQKDLHIGFVHKEPLVDIINRASKNMVYWYVHSVGPSALLHKYGYEEKCNSVCHACKVLFDQYVDKLLEDVSSFSKYDNMIGLFFSKNIKAAANIIASNKSVITQVAENRIANV